MNSMLLVTVTKAREVSLNDSVMVATNKHMVEWRQPVEIRATDDGSGGLEFIFHRDVDHLEVSPDDYLIIIPG